MNPESIIALVQTIRSELRLKRGVVPSITRIYTRTDGSLHIITSDRSEKSLLVGPGGRVAAELSKRLAVPVTVYGDDELLLRKHKLTLTLARIEQVIASCTKMQQGVLQALGKRIEYEFKFPENNIIIDESADQNIRIAVAFSGGADSSASLVILKESGFRPDPIMVDLGYTFLNPRETTKMRDWCSQNGLKPILIQPKNTILNIVQRAKEGRIHPCGECHTLILDSVREYAIENGYSVIVTGELLPTGRQAIEDSGQLITIHLPGALALTKHRTEAIARESGKVTNRRTFGCCLLNESHESGWKMTGPSMFRVLRELEAGILTSGQALEYIKSIVKSKQTKNKG
jgi:predicted PP-loop superfamily ATPase